MTDTYDVLIVGAGNLGLWTAYELAQRKAGTIAVCERYWAGFGATTRSAGVVRQQGGSETAIKLGKWSRERYLRLGREIGLESGFTKTGYFVLAGSEEEKQGFLTLVRMRQEEGINNEWVDPEEGRRLFPAVNWDLYIGATYCPDDGHVHPPIAARNITMAVAGCDDVTLYEQCPVERIEPSNGGYRVQTGRGTFEAGKVLDAGGPRGARHVAEMLGVDLPVHAARHQIVTFPTLNGNIPQPFPMWFDLARGIYCRSEEQGALLGMSNPEEKSDASDRYQIGFDWAYYEQERPTWETIFPAVAGVPISRAWSASIDYTPDHLPIIDQPLPGFYTVAAGGHGMMWGPGLGMKTAELIATDKITDLQEDEYRLSRFEHPREKPDLIALPFPTS